jgi:hypothetical protein
MGILVKVFVCNSCFVLFADVRSGDGEIAQEADMVSVVSGSLAMK